MGMAVPQWVDPYKGWRAVGSGNVTAHQIMTDTSSSGWECTFSISSNTGYGFRIYERGGQR